MPNTSRIKAGNTGAVVFVKMINLHPWFDTHIQTGEISQSPAYNGSFINIRKCLGETISQVWMEFPVLQTPTELFKRAKNK